MNPLLKGLAGLGAVLSIAATLFNLYCILNFDETDISATKWIAMLLFCIAAYGFWFWSALALAKQSNLKRWPLLFMVIHPMIAIFFYWMANRRALLENRPNPPVDAGPTPRG